MQNRKTEYPKVGDTIQVTIGKTDEAITLAFYEVKEADSKTKAITLEFFDIKLVKESDIPI